MKQGLLIITIGLIFQTGFSQKTIEKDFKKHFDKYGVDGCFVLYNQYDKEYIRYNSNLCDTGYLPASTFKIPNSIIALEEKISSKLKEKLQLFDAYNKNLSVTGKMPKSFMDYEIVFFDSVTSMGMEPEELEEIQEKYPGICFIYILQTNKQGSFYGKKKWEHLCDVVLRFEDGVVKVDKNRFGRVGEYNFTNSRKFYTPST